MTYGELCRNIALLYVNDNEFGLNIGHKPIGLTVNNGEHYLLSLGACQVPLKRILSDLTLIDQIKLTSSSKQIREAVKINSQSLRTIEEISSFNLDLFPEAIITKKEIDTLHRVFENMKKLKIDLTYAQNGFLDNIQKFNKLEKINVYLGQKDRNLNQHFLYIKSLTIKAKFNHSDTDVVYSLLNRIHGLKIISLYFGCISIRSTTLFDTRKLQKLKINNSRIKNCIYFIRYLLDSKSLEHVKITSSSYVAYPHPIYIMSDVIGQLNKFELNWNYLSFTVDTSCKIKYEI